MVYIQEGSYDMFDKVVLTNGSFDFFHYGHLKLLQAARELGNSLTVLVDTDAWLEEQKGNRHFVGENERVQMLLGLRCVDVVGFIRSEENFLKQVQSIKPAIYVKGGEYTRDTLKPDGVAKLLDELGTEIVFLPMTDTKTRIAIGLAKSFRELFIG